MILRDWFRQYVKLSFRRRPYDEIDPLILPLVDLMNKTGVITTIASCQGHALSGKEPYVYFQASERVAASMERAVRTAYATGTSALNTAWHIEGFFNERFELAYRLRASYYEEKANAVLGGIAALWFGRSRLDHDFAELGRLFHHALDYQGKLDKPEISAATDRNQACRRES